MALATQCPHCHTTFRVAHDQLKLRAGLVRCGACKEIFNGIEHLLPASEPDSAPPPANIPPLENTPDIPVDDDVQEQAMPVPGIEALRQKAGLPQLASEPGISLPKKHATAHEVTEPAKADASPDFFDLFSLMKPAEPAAKPSTNPPARPDEPSTENIEDDPLQRMTLMDFKEEQQEADPDSNEAEDKHDPMDRASADRPDLLNKAIDDLQRRPRNMSAVVDEIPDVDDEEPSFVIHGRRKQKFGRITTILVGIGSLVLTLTLLAQAAYAFRTQIAARFPDAKPLLVQACATIGCRVDLPTQIEAVSIESSELQSVSNNKNVLSLNALLRNHGPVAQAWPHIELTLNDANEKPVARRVLAPADYLPAGQDLAKGFAATSEQPVKLFFELSQLKPAGYRVYLFYP